MKLFLMLDAVLQRVAKAIRAGGALMAKSIRQGADLLK
jgi:hypothetical protein